jgi:hypothetical protein
MVKDMRDVEFKDYSAKTVDDDGDEHTQTESAHVVTKDTADILGTVLTHSGPHNVRPGDVLVKTDRPDFYNLQSSKNWDDAGYQEGDGKNAPVVSDRSDDDSDKESDKESDKDDDKDDDDSKTVESRTVAKTTAKATPGRR